MMHGHDDDGISGEPLTPEENKKLRRIIRDEDRMRWFWATVRLWAGWTAAALAGIYASYQFLAHFIKVSIK